MPRRTVHIYLTGPYTITAKQIQPGCETKEIDLKLTAMTIVDPTTRWFETVEVPYYGIGDVNNNEQDYIDKNSA